MNETTKRAFDAAKSHVAFTKEIASALALSVRALVERRPMSLRERGALAAAVRELAEAYSAIGRELGELGRELTPEMTAVGWTDREGSE